MKKAIIAALIGTLAIAACSTLGKRKMAAADDVEICHLTPVRQHPVWTTMYVTPAQVNFHLSHGDYLGACQ